MKDVKIPFVGGRHGGIAQGDRLLTYDKFGVKKLEVSTTALFVINGVRIQNRIVELEFPAIGGSLPCVFNVVFMTEGSTCSVRVVEYGNQPDPDYFNITGVDGEGKPVYAEETNAELDTSIPMGD